MEYWDPIFLMDLEVGIGKPLKIDVGILRKEMGNYSRILVDIKITKNLP